MNNEKYDHLRRKIRCWWVGANDKDVWSLENLPEPKRNNET